MSEETYIPDQTYTLGGTNYWSGQPMPREVAEKHGIIDDQSDTSSSDDEGEGEASGDLPDDFPWREQLIEAGYTTLDQIVHASVEELDENVANVGESRAENIQEAANELLAA